MSEPIRLVMGGTKITVHSPALARQLEEQGYVRVNFDGAPIAPEPVQPEPVQPLAAPAETEPEPVQPVKKGKKSAA